MAFLVATGRIAGRAVVAGTGDPGAGAPVHRQAGLRLARYAFARRIAAFDKVAVTGIKKLVDVATLTANGLQQPDGIETDLGTAIGKLRQIA